MSCKNCIYADISNKPRTIVIGNMVINQNANGINCLNEHIRNISFSNGEMICSEYKEKNNEN